MISLSYSYKLIIDSIAYSHAFFTERDVNVIPAELKINEGISMKALGQI
jgi:hypothetical protein